MTTKRAWPRHLQSEWAGRERREAWQAEASSLGRKQHHIWYLRAAFINHFKQNVHVQYTVWQCVKEAVHVLLLCVPCSIVKERRVQKNFQLIVITHDSEFVDMLGRSQFVDDFYEVTKNRE